MFLLGVSEMGRDYFELAARLQNSPLYRRLFKLRYESDLRKVQTAQRKLKRLMRMVHDRWLEEKVK